MSAMGSVELMLRIAIVAGVLFPFSWIPAAVLAGIDEKRRLQAEAAAEIRQAPAAGDCACAAARRSEENRVNYRTTDTCLLCGHRFRWG